MEAVYTLYTHTYKIFNFLKKQENKYDDLHITSVIFNFQIKEQLFPKRDSVRREEKKNETYYSGQINNLIGCFGAYYFYSKDGIKTNIIYIIF